jgi:acyl-coenzyme A synthetase/AMP-(fatty) acid ligase
MTIQSALLQSLKKYNYQKAIITDSYSVSYGELFEKASHICSCLISKHFSNKIVSLLFTLQEHYIYSIIGTIFSANIFMPLDITHPIGRLIDCFIISESQHLLTDKNVPLSIIKKIKKQGIEIIYIEDILQEYSGTYNFPFFDENDAIYIYFTSGSTGKSKAVLGRNQSLLHFIEWEQKEFNVNEDDVFAQMTSPAFDPYLRDIFTPLYSGAKIHLANRNCILVPRLFGNFLHESKITFLHTTPSILKSLLSFSFEENHFENLRYMLIAGEVLSPSLINNWYSKYNHHTVLVNLYGPTETTLAKVFSRIPYDFLDEIVPVGQPINDTNIYIVNEDASSECSAGEIGEVYIETDYMTHGYYKDENHPSFGISRNKKKWYATGDLGYIKNNNLFLIGRKDDQKKIGGVRVDLNEIKNIVLAYDREKIDDCVVLYENNEIICFYIYPVELEIRNIRVFLETRLLPIHIPHKFIKVTHFPITQNGKLDKNKLVKEFL